MLTLKKDLKNRFRKYDIIRFLKSYYFKHNTYTVMYLLTQIIIYLFIENNYKWLKDTSLLTADPLNAKYS